MEWFKSFQKGQTSPHSSYILSPKHCHHFREKLSVKVTHLWGAAAKTIGCWKGRALSVTSTRILCRVSHYTSSYYVISDAQSINKIIAFYVFVIPKKAATQH